MQLHHRDKRRSRLVKRGETWHGARMAKPTTRDRLKVAARQLIATRGLDVGVRDILHEAGTRNASALSYHFGSKEGLIEELLRDILRYASDRWDRALDDHGGAARATTREIVTVIVNWAEWGTDTDPSPNVTRFMAHVVKSPMDRSASVREMLAASAFNRMLREIALKHPEIPAPIMRQRLIFFSWYLLVALSGLESAQATGKPTPVWAAADARANLIDTALAMLEAPIVPAGAVP